MGTNPERVGGSEEVPPGRGNAVSAFQGSPVAPGMPLPRISAESPAQDKIALFRSLFRGRDDVYPVRFESRRTGRSGYQPACGNEWVPGVCEKPRIRCSECAHRRLLPVTDEVVR